MLSWWLSGVQDAEGSSESMAPGACLRAGVNGVHFQFHFFTIATEVRPEELQTAGEAEQRLLEAGGREADPGGPATIFDPVRQAQLNDRVPDQDRMHRQCRTPRPTARSSGPRRP